MLFVPFFSPSIMLLGKTYDNMEFMSCGFNVRIKLMDAREIQT